MWKWYCIIINYGSFITRLFKGTNVEAQIDKASLIDLSGSVGAERINGYDLLVSSTKVENSEIKIPVIIGIGLLTGIGEDEVLEEIKDVLTK